MVTISDASVLWDLDEAIYLSDPVEWGSLSVSGARRLLPPYCPAQYQYERTHPPTSDVFDFGHAAHKLVLGAGAELGVAEADSWRTKAARDLRDEIRADGRVPILAADYARAQEMAEAVRLHPLASLLLMSGDPEVSCFWQDDDTSVWRRGRIDWLRREGPRPLLIDYKTTVSANPDSFGRSAANYGYAQQAAWYLDGARALAEKLGIDGDPAFLFIAQEKTAPYLVSVIELDSTAIRIGSELNRRALETYRICAAKDEWPGYTADDIALVSLPAWYERQAQELTA